MTKQRREEILSKDILLIKDVQELNDMTYQPAAKLIRDIKRMMKSTYDEVGKIATRDYVKFFEGQIPVQEQTVEQKPVPIRQAPKRDIPLFRAKDYMAR